jgi:hypothetical protein
LCYVQINLTVFVQALVYSFRYHRESNCENFSAWF